MTNKAQSTNIKIPSKKSLTKGERCGNIVKLSQRDGAKKAAESRPIEGKELAEGKRRSEAGTKKS